MPDDNIEQRFSSLTQELSNLQTKFNSLTERINAIEAFQEKHGVTLPHKTAEEEGYTSLPDLDSEKIWDKMAASSFLPRIATICFILVFALILRTLTDNDIINTKLGSFIGIGYASFLIAWGVRLLKRQSKLASVFQVCGVVLMYTITLETHARFESFSSLAVYSILFALVLAVSFVSIRCQFSGLNILGIFGTCVVAAAIDFPEPNFAQLGILLFTGNILAYISAKKLGKGEWNRFLVFLLTIGIWLLWSFRLQAEINLIDQPMPAFVSQAWFFPLLLVFALAFMIMPMISTWQKRKLSLFDLILPTLNVLWSYPLAAMILQTTGSSSLAGDLPAVLWSCGHFAFVAYLLTRREIQMPALCAYLVAACLLLIESLPGALGEILYALPIWSLIALLLAKVSLRKQLGGVRFISYLLQSITCFLAILSGNFSTSSPQPLMVIAGAATLTFLSATHFRLMRSNPCAAEGFIFTMVDRHDRSAITLFVASLLAGFATLQVAAYQGLKLITQEPTLALIGIQSLLLNLGAISLLFFAKQNRNKEFLTIAVLVTIIGGFKVFCYDLFKSAGMPLVFSVLSFGVVAATASVVLGRWNQRVTTTQAD